MKITIKISRSNYGEVWLGGMLLASGDMINPRCLMEILTKLGYGVEVVEL